MSHLKKLKIRLQSEANPFLCQQWTNNQRKPFWDADGVIVHKLIKLPYKFGYKYKLEDEIYMNIESSLILSTHD